MDLRFACVTLFLHLLILLGVQKCGAGRILGNEKLSAISNGDHKDANLLRLHTMDVGQEKDDAANNQARIYDTKTHAAKNQPWDAKNDAADNQRWDDVRWDDNQRWDAKNDAADNQRWDIVRWDDNKLWDAKNDAANNQRWDDVRWDDNQRWDAKNDAADNQRWDIVRWDGNKLWDAKNDAANNQRWDDVRWDDNQRWDAKNDAADNQRWDIVRWDDNKLWDAKNDAANNQRWDDVRWDDNQRWDAKNDAADNQRWDIVRWDDNKLWDAKNDAANNQRWDDVRWDDNQRWDAKNDAADNQRWDIVRWDDNKISDAKNDAADNQRWDDMIGTRQTSSHIHDHMDPTRFGLFHLEELKLGKTMITKFHKTDPSSSLFLLPKAKAETIPFSLKKFPSLLQFFSFSQESPQAKAMEDTLRSCEAKPVKGETKFCATSLESMLNFARETFGLQTNAKVLSTVHLTRSTAEVQKYTIVKVSERISAPKVVGCHPMRYPYRVFYCHNLEGESRVYKVSLNGDNGDRVEAIAVCHMDTSHWRPDHFSFRVLGIEPGTSPVCHFFAANNLVLVPSASV